MVPKDAEKSKRSIPAPFASASFLFRIQPDLPPEGEGQVSCRATGVRTPRFDVWPPPPRTEQCGRQPSEDTVEGWFVSPGLRGVALQCLPSLWTFGGASLTVQRG